MSESNAEQTSGDTSQDQPAASEPKLVYEVTIDDEGTPKGGLIQIPGLGTFKNGDTFDVDADEAAAFRAYHTTQTLVVDDDGNAVLSDDGSYQYETEQGPTLLQAAKSMNGVEVATYVKGGNS